ncbi:MAG: hypothetical protein CSA20_08075 [Deltaproteobacteria bacterium]|nr:MAG: hypothetical protein CSA20_08075 [Deltaproteobacteria bacterium]
MPWAASSKQPRKRDCPEGAEGSVAAYMAAEAEAAAEVAEEETTGKQLRTDHGHLIIARALFPAHSCTRKPRFVCLPARKSACQNLGNLKAAAGANREK